MKDILMQEKIWIVDEAKFSVKLLEAMAEDKAVIHDGVAYSAKDSGGKGIIQHIPFKETSIEGIEDALRMAQSTAVMATAISTGIILAALIVQTRYLAAKLDKIQGVVDVISKDVHSQSILFYMDKIAEYVGQLEVARSYLKDRTLIEEVRELAIPLLTALASKRNQVLSFIKNILDLAKSSKDITAKHFDLIVNFVQLMLELMPAGIHTEYLLTARIGKLRLAEHVLIDGQEKFNLALNVFREFMNGLHREFTNGCLGDRKDVYLSVQAKTLDLIKSEHNKILLSLPTGRVALFAPV